MEITGDIRNPDAIINISIGENNYTGKSGNIFEMIPFLNK